MEREKPGQRLKQKNQQKTKETSSKPVSFLFSDLLF